MANMERPEDARRKQNYNQNKSSGSQKTTWKNKNRSRKPRYRKNRGDKKLENDYDQDLPLTEEDWNKSLPEDLRKKIHNITEQDMEEARERLDLPLILDHPIFQSDLQMILRSNPKSWEEFFPKIAGRIISNKKWGYLRFNSEIKKDYYDPKSIFAGYWQIGSEGGCVFPLIVSPQGHCLIEESDSRGMDPRNRKYIEFIASSVHGFVKWLSQNIIPSETKEKYQIQVITRSDLENLFTGPLMPQTWEQVVRVLGNYSLVLREKIRTITFHTPPLYPDLGLYWAHPSMDYWNRKLEKALVLGSEKGSAGKYLVLPTGECFYPNNGVQKISSSIPEFIQWMKDQMKEEIDPEEFRQIFIQSQTWEELATGLGDRVLICPHKLIHFHSQLKPYPSWGRSEETRKTLYQIIGWIDHWPIVISDQGECIYRLGRKPNAPNNELIGNTPKDLYQWIHRIYQEQLNSL